MKGLLCKACYCSYGTTRLELMMAIKVAFALHSSASSRLCFRVWAEHDTSGEQNITPDAILGSSVGANRVLGEVGQSQSKAKPNEQADEFLTLVLGAQVIILIKIFDNRF